MSTTHNVPQGDLVLRTLAMPADTNANGDIFGGWLMSQMDIGGAILAKEIAHGRVVTVRVEGMTFSSTTHNCGKWTTLIDRGSRLKRGNKHQRTNRGITHVFFE